MSQLDGIVRSSGIKGWQAGKSYGSWVQGEGLIGLPILSQPLSFKLNELRSSDETTPGDGPIMVLLSI